MIDMDIIIQVVSMDEALRLAIDAPKQIKIERGKYYEKHSPTPECISHTRTLKAAKK